MFAGVLCFGMNSAGAGSFISCDPKMRGATSPVVFFILSIILIFYLSVSRESQSVPFHSDSAVEIMVGLIQSFWKDF